MEQQEVLFVKTLGNQTREIVLGLRKEDPNINIQIVHETLESVCFVLRKISEEKLDIESLCENILQEEPIRYRTYWQVNVGTRKFKKEELTKKNFGVEKIKHDNSELKVKNNIKTESPSLAWKIL